MGGPLPSPLTVDITDAQAVQKQLVEKAMFAQLRVLSHH